MDIKQYFQKLIYSFLLLFGFLCVSGVLLIFTSFHGNRASETHAKATVEETKVDFELKTGIPGIVLVFVGGVGLITLLIKIPVKQAVQVMASEPSTGERMMDMSMYRSTSTRTVYRDMHAPLLLYWLLKKRMNLKRP